MQERMTGIGGYDTPEFVARNVSQRYNLWNYNPLRTHSPLFSSVAGFLWSELDYRFPRKLVPHIAKAIETLCKHPEIHVVRINVCYSGSPLPVGSCRFMVISREGYDAEGVCASIRG